MEIGDDLVRRFSEAVERVHKVAERAHQANGNHGTSTVTINAGGIGVWIATTACAVMLASLLVGAFWVSREFTRLDARLNDQTDVDSVQDAYIHKLRAEQQKQEKP